MGKIYFIDNKLDRESLKKLFDKNKGMKKLHEKSFNNVLFKDKLNYYELISGMKFFELLLENSSLLEEIVKIEEAKNILNKNLNIIINMINKYIFRYEIANNSVIINPKEKFTISNKRPYIKDDVSGIFGLVVKGKYYNIYKKTMKENIEEWKLFFVPLTYFAFNSFKNILLEYTLLNNKIKKVENNNFVILKLDKNKVKLIFKPLNRKVIIDENEVYSILNILTKIFSYNKEF